MPDDYAAASGRPPAWAPPLYHDFTKWVQTQTRNSLGYFELRASPAIAWDIWSAAAKARVKNDAFVFMALPEGSELVLVRVADDQPNPVVLFGSEGQLDVVADSFEAFLLALSKGETSVDDLDEQKPSARKRLEKWLDDRKNELPSAQPFDFEDWLAGKRPTAKSDKRARQADAIFAGDAEALEPFELDPLMAQLISMLGRRSDDPVLGDFMARTVGKKCPPTLRESKWVTWSKVKIDLLFDPDVGNAKYPPVAKASSHVPYLMTLEVSRTRLKLPFGAKPTLTEDEARALFGRAIEHAAGPRWHAPLIANRDVVLSYYPDSKLIYLRIKTDDEAFSTKT